MQIEQTYEQELRREIERLRAQFPDTQDLYREVCVLLFFRHGVTPTANKLYQLVRKGSMSAPAEALSRFWADLREKSRVRIEHPDLPEDLRTAAGEVTAALWGKAQAFAQDSLAAQKGEAQAAVLEAKTAQAAAEAARDALQQELASVRDELARRADGIRGLEQRLAAEGATRAGLESQLQRAEAEIARLRAALTDARHEFSAELDKLRSAGQLAEERFTAAEERALLEIDRERTTALKLQKELDQLRIAGNQAAERHREELSAQHSELGRMRQQAGVLEGSLVATEAARDRALAELDELRSRLTDAVSQAAATRAEADNWRWQVETAQRALAEAQPKSGRRPRKRTTVRKDPETDANLKEDDRAGPGGGS